MFFTAWFPGFSGKISLVKISGKLQEKSLKFAAKNQKNTHAF
jgi:hypothetical protein